MASNRNKNLVERAIKGQVPVPFAKKQFFNIHTKKSDTEKNNSHSPTLSLDGDKKCEEDIVPVENIELETHNSVAVFEQENLVDISLSSVVNKIRPVSPTLEPNEAPNSSFTLNTPGDNNKAECDNVREQDNLTETENNPQASVKPTSSLKMSLPITLFTMKKLEKESIKENINHHEKISVKSLMTLCLEVVANVAVPNTCGKIRQCTNEKDTFLGDDISQESDPFSGTDNEEDFVPKKQKKLKKRGRLLSNSSSSSSSSGSSSSSSSSSSSGSSSSSSSNSSASSTSSSSSASTKKGKKRVRNVTKWKKNKLKLLKNSGREYVSQTGKLMKSKEMKPPCSDKCRLSCSTKLTTEKRQKLFNNFWSLGSFQRQRDYLSACVAALNVSVRRLKINATKERRPNCCFRFSVDGKTIRVCKTFLLNTLAIGERMLRTVIQAKCSDTGIVPIDRRGKHSKTNLDPEVTQSVRDHINSIPRVESHYLRAQTTREFIDGGLTIAEMHRHYKQDRESIRKIAAKYEYYAHIFNSEFNISFFTPKKDQCDLCESYKNAEGEEKEALEDRYKEHQKQKKLSRKEKTEDIESCKEPNSSKIVAIYDLQAVMPVPIGNSSAFFYKSKLNCYNFTVTDVKNKTTRCYFWHEGLGNRGAIEIGTCVLEFLKNIAETHPNCDVYFYSDNCCGQQKNRFILAMYYYAVSTLNINSVTHKFLVRGHTQNEGDSAHSIIEKAVKKAKKSGPIYVPSQYVQLIRSAKKTGKAYKVIELNYDNFIDLKALCDEIGMNSSKDIDGNAVRLTEITMIRFIKNQNEYEFKTSYEQENWTKVPIKIRSGTGRKSRKDNCNVQDVVVKPAYNSQIAISERKKKDLSQLIRDNIVPKQYSYFYDSIL